MTDQQLTVVQSTHACLTQDQVRPRPETSRAPARSSRHQDFLKPWTGSEVQCPLSHHRCTHVQTFFFTNSAKFKRKRDFCSFSLLILCVSVHLLCVFEFSRFFRFHFIEMLGALCQFWRTCLSVHTPEMLSLSCLLTARGLGLHNTTAFSPVSWLFSVKMITQWATYYYSLYLVFWMHLITRKIFSDILMLFLFSFVAFVCSFVM